MAILTYGELNDVCLSAMGPRVNQSWQFAEYLENIYSTGCRPAELLDVSRWSIGAGSTVVLQPLKGNNERVIEDVSVSALWLDAIDGQINIFNILTERKCRYYYQKYVSIYGLSVGSKDVELYTYRYRYVKSLNLDGFSDLEIQEIMGWTNLSVVGNYVNAVINSPS